MASPYRLYMARMIRNDVLNIGSFTHMSGTATELSTGRRTVIRMTEAEFKYTILRKSGDLCSKSVSTGYIRDQVEENDTFFLMFYYPTPTNKARLNKPFDLDLKRIHPVGFIMAKTDVGAEDLYIDVICSIGKSGAYTQHSGTLLLDEAVTVARRQKLRSITLSSLPHVLTYYRKFQFAHRKSCNAEPNIDLTNALRIRMRDPSSNPLPKTPSQALDDEDMLDYMTMLHERGYGTRYDGECALNGSGKIKKDKFRRAGCGDDGFKMKRCLAAGPSRR